MVEPQGQVRQEQALMLEGEDQPACLSPRNPFSHYLLASPTPWYRLPVSGLGLRARTALVV